MAEEPKAPLSSKPLRPITKTEFKELSFESRRSILIHEAHRLDENCLPDALATLAQGFDHLEKVFNKLNEALEQLPPMEDEDAK